MRQAKNRKDKVDEMIFILPHNTFLTADIELEIERLRELF